MEPSHIVTTVQSISLVNDSHKGHDRVQNRHDTLEVLFTPWYVNFCSPFLWSWWWWCMWTPMGRHQNSISFKGYEDFSNEIKLMYSFIESFLITMRVSALEFWSTFFCGFLYPIKYYSVFATFLLIGEKTRRDFSTEQKLPAIDKHGECEGRL